MLNQNLNPLQYDPYEIQRRLYGGQMNPLTQLPNPALGIGASGPEMVEPPQGNPMQSMMLGLGQKLNQPGFLQQGGMNLYDRANQIDNDADTEFQNAVTQKPKAAMNAGQGNLMLALAALFMLGGAKPGAILNAGQSFMGGLKGRADEDEQRRLDAAKFKYQGAGRKADQTRQKGNMVIGLAQQDAQRRERIGEKMNDREYAESLWQRNQDAQISAEERSFKRQVELAGLDVGPIMRDYKEMIALGVSHEDAVNRAMSLQTGRLSSANARDAKLPGELQGQDLRNQGQGLKNEGTKIDNKIKSINLTWLPQEKQAQLAKLEADAVKARTEGNKEAEQVSFAQRRIILSAEADFIRGRIKEIDDAIKGGTATQAKMAPELNGLKARLQNVRNIFTKMTQEATGLNLGETVKPAQPNLSGLKGPIGFRKGPGGIAVPDIR